MSSHFAPKFSSPPGAFDGMLYVRLMGALYGSVSSGGPLHLSDRELLLFELDGMTSEILQNPLALKG